MAMFIPAFPVALLCASACSAADVFDVHLQPDTLAGLPVIEPWKTIPLDPTHSGQWVVMGDVDGDGQVEIVSARNVDKNDVHFTSAVSVQRLDGSVVWRWGDPNIGRRLLHHDVACQVYDWDGDGRNEVVVATDGFVVELDGATGAERRRLPIPPQAADCLVFANLSGNPRATDVLVKDRYWNIWAYSRDWKPLWHVQEPGGYRTAHHPLAVDVDGDGRDEIMAGYALLNPDGSVRWVLTSEKVKLASAHLDCTRILRRGATPEESRLVHTYCGAGDIAMTDGAGRVLWEVTGHHFESIDIGRIRSDVPGLQIVVDIVEYLAPGKNPTWLLDENGRQLGQFTTPYSRFHTLVDWNGDALEEIVLADVPVICDGHGKPLARLNVGADTQEKFVRTGDMTGDGVPDVAIHTLSSVRIFRNPSGVKPSVPAPLGSGGNATLY